MTRPRWQRALKVLLAGLVGLVAGFFAALVVLVGVLDGGLDPGYNLGIGDRAVNVILVMTSTVAAGLAMQAVARAQPWWMIPAGTVLPPMITQGASWMIEAGEAVDVSPLTFVAVAVGVLLGPVIAARRGRDRSITEQASGGPDAGS